MRRVQLILSGLFLCPSVHAITLTAADLPSAVQACASAGTCSVNLSSSFDSPHMSAFNFTEGNVSKALIRYGVAAPSQEKIMSFDRDSNEYQQIDRPLTGYLWMSANRSPDLSNAGDPLNTRNVFVLYTDHVLPAPGNIWLYGNGVELNLSLTAHNLFRDGGGFLRAGLRTDPDNNHFEFREGSLQTHSDLGYGFDREGLVFCAAANCEISAQLNLINLDYSSGLLTFNPNDPRTKIYSQSAEFRVMAEGGFSHAQDYYVNPVPLPGAMGLFASGLIFVGWIKKGKGTKWTLSYYLGR